MANIEAGCMELEPSEFSLPKLLEGLANVFGARAQEKGLKFHYSAATDLPVEVWSDAKKLRQVLANLIGNGVKFTETGEVSLEVGRREERVRFKVVDTGVGVAEESIEEIFAAFKHAPDRRTYAEGAGLGLPISLQMVEMLGGTLQVESEAGKGSVFWFDLELKEVGSSSVDEAQTVGRAQLDAGGAERASAPGVVPPDPDVLELFRDLARSGNMLELQRQAASLVEDSASLAPFASQVMRLARRFDVNAVQKYIEEAGGESS